MNTQDCENNVNTATLALTHHLRMIKEQVEKVEKDMEFHNATMLIMSSLHDSVSSEWLDEVVSTIDKVSFEQYLMRAYENDKVTREDILGLLRYFLEKGDEANDI